MKASQQTLDLNLTPTTDTFTYTPKDTQNKYIWTKPNALSKTFCKRIVAKFKKDDDKYQGKMHLGVDKKIKTSMDLFISNKENYEEEDEVFFKSLSESLDEYQEYLDDTIDLVNFERLGHSRCYILSSLTPETHDSGYQLQETKPGDYYDWHNDGAIECFDESDTMPKIATFRKLTYIWYLNDVSEGGETEFYDGTKIQPEAGKLLIFPATWSFYHRGCPPKKVNKYICTGWVRNSIPI